MKAAHGHDGRVVRGIRHRDQRYLLDLVDCRQPLSFKWIAPHYRVQKAAPQRARRQPCAQIHEARRIVCSARSNASCCPCGGRGFGRHCSSGTATGALAGAPGGSQRAEGPAARVERYGPQAGTARMPRHRDRPVARRSSRSESPARGALGIRRAGLSRTTQPSSTPPPRRNTRIGSTRDRRSVSASRNRHTICSSGSG